MTQLRDHASCLGCGKPFPEDARVDRRYCERRCGNKHYKRIQRGKAIGPPRRDPVALLAQMTPEHRGWVAGIVEGEGSFSCHVTPKIGNDYIYAQVNVDMADEDIIRRLLEWTGVGRVSGPHLPPCRAIAGHKPQWKWHVASWVEVQAVMDALWPLLGQRRREQIDTVRGRMTNRVLKRTVMKE